MTEEKITFTGYISPLMFPDWEEGYQEATGEEPKLESLLNFLCTPGLAYDLPSLIERYRQISSSQYLPIAPDEQTILNKLIWPLRHAKCSYILGNYIGTIALCGMVAEMLALLHFETSRAFIGRRVIAKQRERWPSERKFESFGQKRRVEALKSLGLIDEDTEECFKIIRETRRKYLHHLSQDHEELPDDAVNVFNNTLSLVVKVFGIEFGERDVKLRNTILKYLKDSGIV